MITNGQRLQQAAEALSIAPRTLEQMQEFMADCRRQGSDKSAARLALKHGRMTAEARAWLEREYPQC